MLRLIDVLKVKRGNKKGFTLVELLIATGLSAIFTALLLAALTTSRQFCDRITADQDLQQVANVIMNKIIKGANEPGGVYRLSEATSYTTPGISELRFTGTDGIERRYFITGSSLFYRHPTTAGTVDEVLYTAPAGTSLTLRFWTLSGSNYTNITVGIDVGLSKTINGKAVVGSATTMINIRNHAA
jgi:prepilin-type N-terminal cleavage/methylation domain-containing protein